LQITQSAQVVTVRIEDITADWEQWFLLTSDVHFDSLYCKRDKLKWDFEQAKKKNAGIIIAGDWYDAMQGRADPRREMDDLRPEFRRSDYYDFVVTESARFLDSYKDNLVMISHGNHETSVITHAGTDLTERLVGELRRNGSPVCKGGYGGWIKFMLIFGTRKSINMKYHHGKTGNAPVTKGLIEANRQATYLPDADVVLNGHNHEKYIVEQPRERLSNKGKVYEDSLWFIRTAGYKGGYIEGEKFSVEKGSPKPTGSVWMILSLYSDKIHMNFQTLS